MYDVVCHHLTYVRCTERRVHYYLATITLHYFIHMIAWSLHTLPYLRYTSLGITVRESCMLFKLLQKCTMCKSRVHAVSHFRASQRQHAIFLGIGMWMTASQYSELTKFKKLKQESNYKLRPLQEPRRVHRQPSLCRSARLLPKCTTLKKKTGECCFKSSECIGYCQGKRCYEGRRDYQCARSSQYQSGLSCKKVYHFCARRRCK